eukprot:6192794-Pleurochrysis_carterae.AAC.4
MEKKRKSSPEGIRRNCSAVVAENNNDACLTAICSSVNRIVPIGANLVAVELGSLQEFCLKEHGQWSV